MTDATDVLLFRRTVAFLEDIFFFFSGIVAFSDRSVVLRYSFISYIYSSLSYHQYILLQRLK